MPMATGRCARSTNTWRSRPGANIMIGTHADCVIADALVKGFRGFDSKKAWQAVKKNAYEPSVGDEEHRFEDRMPWFASAHVAPSPFLGWQVPLDSSQNA